MKRTLFIDCHGVLTDAEKLPGEWRRLLGEFFPPRLGGAPQAWAEANRGAIARSFTRLQELAASGVHMAEVFTRIDRDWLRDMCIEVGVPAPATEAQIDALVRESMDYVTRRHRAAQPGAVDAIRELHRRGYPLYTASGDGSLNLAGYLEGMGVRDQFATTYGSDLLGVWKTGAEFYRRLLSHSGIPAERAIAIDDDAYRLDWARECGMETILVSREDGAGHRTVRSFAEVPRILD